MMKLKSSEHTLSGAWVCINDKVQPNDVCKRIEWLIKNLLEKVASSPQWGGWETLFLDLSDGRFWERTYPQGDLQGGGPPQLQVISEQDAKSKYSI